TPPPFCTIHLFDGGSQCAAYIKGCTPGARITDAAKIKAFEALVRALTVEDGGMTLRISAMNLQIVSGAGATDASVNGRGNLIVGYNAKPHDTSGGRTGSHNLVVGDEHAYPSFGGLVAGRHNAITGKSASVTGGEDNTASANFASVTGGQLNTASAS